MAPKKSPQPLPLKSGDKVYRAEVPDQVCIIVSINTEQGAATVNLKDTNLEWFGYPIAKLTRVEK